MKKAIFPAIILLAAALVVGCKAEKQVRTSQSSRPAGAGRGPGTHQVMGFTIPEGFNINVFASDLSSPRLMALSPDGRVFVADMSAGQIVILPDVDKDGAADSNIIYLSELDRPNSIAFHEGYLYVAEQGGVTRYRYEPGDETASEGEAIIEGLPSSGHFTKTIAFGPDGKLYLAMGSSCNVCEESDPQRAAVSRYNPDGTGKEIFATGLRNSVGLAFDPDGELYATENGRDWLGDDIPPEEINIIREGAFYGWPYAYGNKVPDPEFGKLNPEKVQATVPPTVELPAHSAPLGLAFYTGGQFPGDYRGNLFVALHGSWNRSELSGYKIVRVPMGGETPGEPQDFITGFLRNERRYARPVGVLVGPGGEMYISDDRGGRVFRVTYENTSSADGTNPAE